jgi:hypothetical protein
LENIVEVVAAVELFVAAWLPPLGDISLLVEAPLCLLDQDI